MFWWCMCLSLFLSEACVYCFILNCDLYDLVLHLFFSMIYLRFWYILSLYIVFGCLCCSQMFNCIFVFYNLKCFVDMLFICILCFLWICITIVVSYVLCQLCFLWFYMIVSLLWLCSDFKYLFSSCCCFIYGFIAFYYFLIHLMLSMTVY